MSIAEGWYPDPDGKPCERFWNGNEWTSDTRPLSAGQQVTGVSATLGTPVVMNVVQQGPKNGIGNAALWMGILGLLIFPVVFSVLAIIFGFIGVGRAGRGEATNKGVALAGLILGFIGLPLSIILWAWAFNQ